MSSLQKKRILIVDDDLMLCKMLKENLYKQGFKTIETHDGKEALEFIHQNVVDLIILDLAMPVMGGFEFLRILKKENKESKIPIIVLTIRNENEIMEQSFNLEADFFLPKPFKFENLMNYIHLIF